MFCDEAKKMYLGTMKNLLKQLPCTPQAQPPRSPPGQRSDLQNNFEDYCSEYDNSDGDLIKCVLSLYTVTMLMPCNHNRFARPTIGSSAREYK